MQILYLDPEPIAELPCVLVGPGSAGVVEGTIPVMVGTVDALPEPLEGLVVTADLQCHDRQDMPVAMRRLMGSVVVDELEVLAEVGMVPPLDRMGAVLCGDLYARPTLDKRGGSGDVEGVWMDFGRRFRWVVGVAGNHDVFGSGEGFGTRLSRYGHIHPLHDATVEVDGLTVAGFSGVLGKSSKLWRYSERELQRFLRRVSPMRPDLLVLHEGPDNPNVGQRGSSVMRKLLNKNGYRGLLAHGHCYGRQPSARLSRYVQVLNVDSRVVVLQPSAVER